MLGMTSYSAALDANMTALYPPPDLSDTLGAVVAAAGYRNYGLPKLKNTRM